MTEKCDLRAWQAITDERRAFLRTLSAGVATACLAACGSGGDAPAPAPPAPGTPPPPGVPPPPPTAPTPPTAPPPPPAPAPSGARAFHLTSASGGSALPFTIGFAFRPGDIPVGQSIAFSLPGVQATVKNRWLDGSVRFAVIAGRATLATNSVLEVTLSAGAAAASGPALTTADLRSTGVSAIVGCGAFGSASWSDGDWDSPFSTWVTGPEMSSWVYRKRVGTDAHLVAWLEVRLYAGQAVEVLPWVENGYIRVAGPTSKSATYTFSLGGTQRFSAVVDLPSHCRTPLVSGSAFSHWLGTDPGLIPRHDAAYLQSTKLVPTYIASTPGSASVVASLPSTFAPLQLGNYTADMGQTGYHKAIGLLPEWDVLYLTCTAPAAYGGVLRNGYSAGRWGIHYRDESTNRPLRFSQNPTLSINSSTNNDRPPSPSGTSAPAWDIPHHPSLGYMAYLVTGRFYFMEQVQFAATMNYLVNPDGGPYANRNGASGVFLSYAGANTVRGAAWAIRTLAQATVATPDDDSALRNEFIASLEANINFNHARYVAQANNPFGIVQTYGDVYGTGTDGKVTEAPWQQDFYTAVCGYTLALDPPVSSAVKTRLAEFFAWKARSVIGRLGTTAPSEWLYRDAAQYNFVVAFVDSPNWTGGSGPWPASWGAMYQASLGSANPGVTGPLRGGYFPDATSYWGNLQPAIAYAVEHGAPGATEAYTRMTGSTNWSQFVDSANAAPVWSVRPRF